MIVIKSDKAQKIFTPLNFIETVSRKRSVVPCYELSGKGHGIFFKRTCMSLLRRSPNEQ